MHINRSIIRRQNPFLPKNKIYFWIKNRKINQKKKKQENILFLIYFVIFNAELSADSMISTKHRPNSSITSLSISS
jgi:hypothetical protein